MKRNKNKTKFHLRQDQLFCKNHATFQFVLVLIWNRYFIIDDYFFTVNKITILKQNWDVYYITKRKLLIWYKKEHYLEVMIKMMSIHHQNGDIKILK
jgi:hypothetical protein